MRLKPRLNPDVNEYWICDEGRYNYRFIDENRIEHPQRNNELIPWGKAIEAMAQAIKPLKEAGRMDRMGVLASAQLTNEDLFVIRKLFKEALSGAQVDFRVPRKPGVRDDFLLKGDKNPNTVGALTILGSVDNASTIIQKAKDGQVDILYVFGHNLVELYGKEIVEQISKKVKLLVFQGSNINETCPYAHLILPSAVYAEKNGTFTNCQQKVQRVWPAFSPLSEAKGDWEILSLLAEKLDIPMSYKGSQDIFKDLAETIGAFAEMTYESIGEQGMTFKEINREYGKYFY